MMKRFSKIGMLIILVAYLIVMVVIIFKGNLTIRVGLLMTGITTLIIGLLYKLPRWLAHIHRKLYDELRRMMK